MKTLTEEVLHFLDTGEISAEVSYDLHNVWPEALDIFMDEVYLQEQINETEINAHVV